MNGILWLGGAIIVLLGLVALGVRARERDRRHAAGTTLDERLAQGELDAQQYRESLGVERTRRAAALADPEDAPSATAVTTR